MSCDIIYLLLEVTDVRTSMMCNFCSTVCSTVAVPTKPRLPRRDIEGYLPSLPLGPFHQLARLLPQSSKLVTHNHIHNHILLSLFTFTSPLSTQVKSATSPSKSPPTSSNVTSNGNLTALIPKPEPRNNTKTLLFVLPGTHRPASHGFLACSRRPAL